tara:strand:+ start:1527 stop:2912 length:1386 start_codon:yes stop_codon:yes gene_type:complete
MIIIFLFTLTLIFFLTIFFNIRYKELRWNWSEIDINRISFPKSFIWGTATASHQVEGNCKNNWSEFEKGLKSDGSPNIKDNQISGLACDHWNRYKEDIKLIKKLGVGHYRFSVEWSKIEPEMGKYNKEALGHYSNLIDDLLKNNIKPVITLHHFSHPIWFDKIGAFEKKENISYLVSFSERVFDKYSDRVKYWCTINEPGVVAVQGYFTGMFPPGEQNSSKTAHVFKNLLESHVQIYHALKSHINGSKVKIGIVKNINQFEPWRRYHLFDWLFTIALNHIFNWSTINFLKTGKLKFRIPGLMWLTHKNLEAKNSLDFFGLNYYSHNHIKFNLFKKDYSELKYHSKDIMTDMPYTIYAEGIYRAIELVSCLKVPILITENGVADKDDNIRSEYITKYLYAVSKAIDDGYNVVGYYYWSLMDNFEWAFGYDMRFGLYHVDFNNQKRTLKKGSEKFVDIVNHGR